MDESAMRGGLDVSFTDPNPSFREVGGVHSEDIPTSSPISSAGDVWQAGIEAVLLDGLGTLVALEPPWPRLVERLRDTHGVELASADAEHAFRAEIAYYRTHHHEGRDQSTLEDLRRRCAEILRAQLPPQAVEALSVEQLGSMMLESLRFATYPDVPAALARLRASGLTLVVASNWDVSLPAVLRNVGLEGMVDGVVTSAEVGHPKPAPEIFTAALALAGCTPEHAVHVGDSLDHDIHGALAAGIRGVLLCRDNADPGEPPPGVPSISSLAQLPPLLG
jgi:putative hydrolase of the HAD superfamily